MKLNKQIFNLFILLLETYLMRIQWTVVIHMA